jgi:Flp pilus assembly protein TadD
MILQKDKRFVGICLALALITGGVFWPVTQYGFSSLDDPYHILYNRPVNSGLTWQGVNWAMHTGYACNWQPLTWISHMLDCSLYGLRPGGHHLTNLLLHLANTLLLFALMCKMTGARWRSALVAALFAWHPLHVESVAWISERKDVLSGLFFLLTIWAYVGYTDKVRSPWSVVRSRERNPKSEIRNPKEGRNPKSEPETAPGFLPPGAADDGRRTFPASRFTFYALALAFFALGLMSKPMLVTTPFVLLLLDYWPLQRVSSPWSVVSSLKSGAARLDPKQPTSGNRLPSSNAELRTADFGLRTRGFNLVLEKVPFFILSLASSAVTFFVQRTGGAVVSLTALPLWTRVTNAAVSYLRYLEKALWPSQLTICYAYPSRWPAALVVAAALLVGAGCACAWLRARRQPYLLAGWCWFLGMLVPVVGLVQVGAQAMADRYMYLPSIGLLVLLVWGANDLAQWLAKGGSASTSKLCRAFGWRQGRESPVSKWFAAAAGVVVLAVCLAGASRQLEYWRNGETLFRHALAVTADNGPAHDGLGTALKDMGRPNEALVEYRESVRLQPESPDAQLNLAAALLDTGHAEESLGHFEAALRMWPSNARTHLSYGCSLFRLGRFDDARRHFAEAARLDPDSPQIHYNLGTVLLTQAKVEEATVELATAVRLDPGYASEAVKLAPDDALLRYNLGTILLMQSRVAAAAAQLAEAVRLDPKFHEAHHNLGVALIRQGDAASGIQHLSEAARLQPDEAEIRFDLGQALLDQHRAEEAAAQIHEGLRLKPEDARAHYRLAAAYAETGRFTDAAVEAQKAHDLAVSGCMPELANQAGAALKLYQSRRQAR